MKLREISVQATSSYEFQKRFNRETWCVSEMYWRYISKENSLPYEKLVIVLGEDDELETFGKMYCSRIYFDFESYFEKNPMSKKREILNLIHGAVMLICKEEGVNQKPFVEAYNHCLAEDLKNQWLLQDKLVKSKDGKWLGGIVCDWQLDCFKVHAQIKNINDETILFKELMNIEPFFGDFVYWSKFGWTKDNFFLKSKQGEVWEVQCSEIAESFKPPTI